MRIRLQYSLLTLLLLTAVCGIIIAYFVIPWRHEREQSELIERLKNYDHGVYVLSEERISEFGESLGVTKNSYELMHWGREPQHLEFFLEHAAKCERVNAVKFKYDNFTTEQLAKLRRLPRLERFTLESSYLDEERMQILGKMPLKEMHLEPSHVYSFEKWPIQSQLESLTLNAAHTMEFPPLQLNGHLKLQKLHLEGLSKILSLENCPELKILDLEYSFNGDPIELRLRNLPKLESLSLDEFSLLPASRIEELPALQELRLAPPTFKFFRNLQLLKLKELSISFGWEKQLDRAAVERILSFPELQKLTLEADWQDCVDNGLLVPPLPKLKELCLSGNYSNNKRHLPDQLMIQILRQTPALERLVLYVENASDELLQAIVQLDNLETLYVRLGEHGTHGDLSVLLKSKKLNSFDLNGKPGWPAAQASP